MATAPSIPSPSTGGLAALKQRAVNRWISSSDFMAGRRFRLGPLYRVIGVCAETMVKLANRRFPASKNLPHEPKSIFVLRNNDIGDLIVSTPLFDALRRKFPTTHLVAGVGSWNKAPLENNPYIDEIIAVDAPWYNHFTKSRSVAAAFAFAMRSPMQAELKARHFEVGIDVVGTHFGALLMINAGIPYRVGMKGYAGGHSAMSVTAPFRDDEHVSRSSLRLAEALGATDLPEPRPQLFLSDSERQWAEQSWAAGGRARKTRILLGCGGKLDKIWPMERWLEFTTELARRTDVQIGLVGGPQDVEPASRLFGAARGSLNWAGNATLRQTFALVASANLVACNDSMLTHASAAFGKPTLTLLGKSTSVSVQSRLWGYPPPSRMVGQDGPGTDIATVQEAINHLMTMGREAGFFQDGI